MPFSVPQKHTAGYLPVTSFDQNDTGKPSPFRSPILAFEEVSETVSRGKISNERRRSNFCNSPCG